VTGVFSNQGCSGKGRKKEGLDLPTEKGKPFKIPRNYKPWEGDTGDNSGSLVLGSF